MLRRILLAGAVVGAVLAVPTGAAAQAPRQDSVTLTGGPGVANEEVVFTLNATSGPSGENPSGQVRFTALGVFDLSGPVTCLAVRGNTATINFQDQTGGFGITTVQVVDDQPDSFDAIPTGRAPSDCSPLPFTGFGGPLSGADVVVVDAPPLPTSTEQCKRGGWLAFGVFKNQGDCVSFVATKGKNPPAQP
jgi:hypothetical protein